MAEENTSPIKEEEKEEPTDAVETIDSSNVIEKDIEKDIESVQEPNKFALTDLDNIKATIPSLNYIETGRMRSRVSGEYDKFKMAKTLLESIENMNNVDNTNRKILRENVVADTKYKKDADGFLAEYDENAKRFDDVLATLDARTAEFDDTPKTSSFLNGQMEDSINKRIKERKAKGFNDSDYLIVYYTYVKNVYTNRTNLDYIRHKASFGYVIRKYRSELKNRKEDSIKKCRKELNTVFTINQIHKFEEVLLKLFYNDDKAETLFMYHMYKLIAAEKDSGKYNWIKVMIMNVLDIEGGIYDLEPSAEEYYNQLSSLYTFYKY